MSRPRPLILLTEHLSPAAIGWLRERSDLVQADASHPQFREAISKAEALIVRTYTIVDESLLDRAPRLRVVARAGAGLDNVDVASCRKRGVEVVYAPNANTQAVVEYVVALACDALRPRVMLSRACDLAAWNQLRASYVAAREMREMTLGILGLGRIGQRLAQIAHSLFAKVIYTDLQEMTPGQRRGALPVSVQQLFSRADVLSVHIDGRPSNRHYIGARLLGQMKEDAVLINTSRGFIVDNLSLAYSLKERPRAKAMLDVHEPEPFAGDYPLLAVPNAHLYPHLASRSETAMENMSWVVRDVMAVLEGRQPEHAAPQP